MGYFRDIIRYVFHRKYRREVKWRRKNAHNFTTLKDYGQADKVIVGNMTYGEIYACGYGVNDGNLIIGNYCSIASEVTFHLSGNHHMNTVSTYPFEYYCLGEKEASWSKGDIVIDDDVWIGYGATILSGVHIGKGAVVTARAVVTKDVPPYAVVGGVPAKCVKMRFSQDIIEKMMTIDYSKITKEEVQKNRKLFMEVADNVLDEFLLKYGKW